MTTEHEHLTQREWQDRAHEEAERWVDECTGEDCTCVDLPLALFPGARLIQKRATCPLHGDREAAIQARAEDLMDTPDELEYEHPENR